MPNEIFLSQDGSHSIHSEKFGVSYHSKYGAIAESNHVFIDAGLQYLLDKNVESIKILEMGFGTGLNALLTYDFAINHPIKVDYHTYEKFPLVSDITTQLNYLEELKLPHLKQHFNQMHDCVSDERQNLHPNFNFTKYLQDILKAELPQAVDLIYYDAFAPNSQAELWDDTILSKLYNCLNPGGVMTTYCAKGSFKRTMKSVGFTIDNIPGPYGKREMTRGIKLN